MGKVVSRRNGRLTGSAGYSSFRRYCGIWLAEDSAATAACTFTCADDSLACSAAMSTSRMAELAACRFCDWVEIELALKLKRDSWAPIVARAADTVSMAVSSASIAVVAPACVLISTQRAGRQIVERDGDGIRGR